VRGGLRGLLGWDGETARRSPRLDAVLPDEPGDNDDEDEDSVEESEEDVPEDDADAEEGMAWRTA